MLDNTIQITTNCWIIATSQVRDEIDLQWFDDKYWLNQGRLLGASSGRGSAWMVKSEQGKMMLRHYYRGGIPAKFIKDKYLWLGQKHTRSFSEFYLLEKMIELQLPVPKPVAALVCKSGLFYQANILIEYINHTSTFAKILNTNNNSDSWKNIGKTIALFHNHGIYHADLNAHNILINEERIYLIDFDHSYQRASKLSWQQANLIRLKRSIDKLTTSNHIENNNNKWQLLLDSYNNVIR